MSPRFGISIIDSLRQKVRHGLIGARNGLLALVHDRMMQTSRKAAQGDTVGFGEIAQNARRLILAST